jgi:predicted AlkP superfamily pyrophosphatase or phosphodiesterase
MCSLRKKLFKTAGLIVWCLFALWACNTLQAAVNPARPHLVIGIVIDQMKYDYLFRFHHQFGQGGFKRLMREGMVFHNARFNYVPTFTGPGHASIYTGTTPSVHGIIANEWYDRQLEKEIYCVSDTTVSILGNRKSGLSPVHLLTTTITDELRISTNFQSRVISIAFKDRGAILPAGFSANAAYWLDFSTGQWVSSTWYMSSLPHWVRQFNETRSAKEYLKSRWKTLYPIEQYTQSTADNNPYEEPLPGEQKPVFPHDIPTLAKDQTGIIRYVPDGNTLTTDFAMTAIRSEILGKDTITDFLCISYSTPDYIGHQFGTHSIELQDCYLRLDRDIENLLAFLDREVGKDKYLVFLTSDHGASPNPAFLNDHKIPAGYYQMDRLLDTLNAHLSTLYGSGRWVNAILNDQVYLNQKLMKQAKTDAGRIRQSAADFLEQFEPVVQALTSDQLRGCEYTRSPLSLLQNGFHPKRSGDVVMLIKPGFIEWQRKTGTNHGSPFSYDTHVPLIFFGHRIRPGNSVRPVQITDIAPTLSVLLGCEFPNGCTGHPIPEIFGE